MQRLNFVLEKEKSLFPLSENSGIEMILHQLVRRLKYFSNFDDRSLSLWLRGSKLDENENWMNSIIFTLIAPDEISKLVFFPSNKYLYVCKISRYSEVNKLQLPLLFKIKKKNPSFLNFEFRRRASLICLKSPFLTIVNVTIFRICTFYITRNLRFTVWWSRHHKGFFL